MTSLRIRPTAETFPLDDLVEHARHGRIRVPSFQRGLRWTRRDVVALFDSILNGYPVGSLLLWERQAPAEVVALGPLQIHAGAGQAFYVVDGQQRITALASALTLEGQRDARFAVGFDLTTKEFVAQPRNTETWIPAHVLYDLTSLLPWFRARPDLEREFDAAAAVSKTLRDLRLPAYVVRQDDEAVLRAIFDRMNNAGKKLTRGEVFGALHRTDDPAGATLGGVAEQIEMRTGFGVLDDSMVMKLVLARRGPDVMREIRNEFDARAKGRDDAAAGEDEATAYSRTADAAVLAIQFLQNDALVPHQALLPYEQLLVTLTRFFSYHPAPTPRHRQLLRRFLWRAVMAGPSLLRGDTTGTGRLLNRAVVSSSELTSVKALLAAAPASPSPVASVDPFRTNSAATKALLAALWQHSNVSLVSGDALEVEELRAALGDQRSAAELVVPLVSGRRAEQQATHAGNRLLLASSLDRSSDLAEIVEVASEESLAAHLLEPDDLILIRAGDVGEFVARRTRRLEALQATFAERMCEWAQEDTLDVDLLLAEEEIDG